MALSDTDLVVDLSRVELMTAATIGVLARARELLALRSRSLVLRAPSVRARRTLGVSALCDLVQPRRTRRFTEVTMLDRAPRTTLARPAPAEATISHDARGELAS
jgi:anti-anti-sigma regulatory factor